MYKILVFFFLFDGKKCSEIFITPGPTHNDELTFCFHNPSMLRGPLIQQMIALERAKAERNLTHSTWFNAAAGSIHRAVCGQILCAISRSKVVLSRGDQKPQQEVKRGGSSISQIG